MSIWQSYDKPPRWLRIACWAHELPYWWDVEFFKRNKNYLLKFDSDVSGDMATSYVDLFMEHWKELFRDSFTYTFEGKSVVVEVDTTKYSCLANLYGMMGALRYIEEYTGVISKYKPIHEKYGSKLNTFQKLYLCHFFGPGYYGGHDYLKYEYLRDGHYCLKYFEDAKGHVDRFLGEPLARDTDTIYSVAMTATIWPKMGYKGPPFKGMVPMGSDTTIIPYMGVKL